MKRLKLEMLFIGMKMAQQTTNPEILKHAGELQGAAEMLGTWIENITEADFDLAEGDDE